MSRRRGLREVERGARRLLLRRHRPSREGHPPISGKLLERAHLQLESGRLEWDTYDDVACAYRVKGLTMIVAYGPDDPA
jgi:hypothetical protein